MLPAQCLLFSIRPSRTYQLSFRIAFMTWHPVSHDDAADHTVDPPAVIAFTTSGPQRPKHSASVLNQDPMANMSELGSSYGFHFKPLSNPRATPPTQPTMMMLKLLHPMMTTTSLMMMMLHQSQQLGLVQPPHLLKPAPPCDAIVSTPIHSPSRSTIAPPQASPIH